MKPRTDVEVWGLADPYAAGPVGPEDWPYAHQYDQLLVRLEDYDALRAERDSLKTAYDVVRADCVNLTEKVIPNLRARVAELEADAEAGRKLWAYMVKNRLPWSDYDLQDALTAIGLLVAKDMDGEDEAQQCLNCDGDCHTCYRVSETLLVERATERQRPVHE